LKNTASRYELVKKFFQIHISKILPVSLRHKFILYLLFIHLAFAGVAIFLLWEKRLWLLAVEAFFVLSFFLALRLFRALFEPLDLVMAGVEFIKDKDFTSKFNEVGQPEMDELIAVYNRMIDHLREERTRLQEQHYFMDKILRASPSGIVTFDLDEKIAMVNPSAEQILQLASENLIGRKLVELHTPFAEALNCLHVGESQVIPFQGRRRVKCQKSQYFDRGFARSFILIEELTEELRRSEKAAYEKLIRMMSHEVNNSIGAVNSLLHSFLNYKSQLRDDDRQDYENALTVAIARTEHLNAFMRSFADVVRLPLPKRQPSDLPDLLESIALLMSAESQRRGIVWKWVIEAPLAPIAMDKNQMEQVFVNLFKNALEAIGKNGTITIRLGKKGKKSFVLIEDTGCGLTPEVRANLFTPFFSTKENGQGIGLTMIQEILSQHRFEFSLDSQPGGPTQFVIYF
jgi:nitrogen fixation/metabolism regulation signal transduction histidine kinase